MLTLTVTTWSEGRGLSECGVQIDGTRHTTEDLDEITCREEAEAAGIPTALLDEYRGNGASSACGWRTERLGVAQRPQKSIYRNSASVWEYGRAQSESP